MTEIYPKDQSPPQTLQQRLDIQRVPMQETKCSNKEKTHAFSGWQQQVSTRLRTGQDTSTEIPERIILNVLWSCHLSCRSAFPNYCTICSNFPLQLHSLKITKLRKMLLSQVKGNSWLLRKEEKLELTLSWTTGGRRQRWCGKWAPPSRDETAQAVPPPVPRLSEEPVPTTQHPDFLSAWT